MARDEVRTIQLELEEAQVYLAEATWVACDAGASWDDVAAALGEPAAPVRHEVARHG